MNDQQGSSPFGPGADMRIRVLRLKPWQVWLGGGLALILGVSLALLATGILLIALPVALLAGFVWSWTGRSRMRARPPADGVIDAEYRVIEPATKAPSGDQGQLPR